MMLISQESLKQLLDYNPEDGVFHWRVTRGPNAKAGQIAGTITIEEYRNIGVNGLRYRAHRLAWLWVYGKFPDGDIDHINGERSDNRIANLRDASKNVNAQNLRKANCINKSKLLGVYKQGKRFRAEIVADGKRHRLGYFQTAEEAHAAYILKKREVHEGCTI